MNPSKITVRFYELRSIRRILVGLWHQNCALVYNKTNMCYANDCMASEIFMMISKALLRNHLISTSLPNRLTSIEYFVHVISKIRILSKLSIKLKFEVQRLK